MPKKAPYDPWETIMPDFENHFLNIKKRVIFFLILAVLFIGRGEAAPLPVGEVQNAIQAAAGYLVSKSKENGMFEYRINMDPRIIVKEKYNILRHAGAIYALTQYYQYQPDADTLSVILRAGRYLQTESMHPVPGMEPMLAIWSDPEINRSGKPLQAKLGGTGLGLLALLSIEKIHPGFTPLRDLQALGRFIVYMQKDDGNVYSKFIPSQGGRWDKWESLYYPGEAAFGLLMLYEQDPSDIWLKSACRILDYLARSRENSTDIPADHWALLATGKLLSFENRVQLPVSIELLTNHAFQICDSMLQSQIKGKAMARYNGGFDKDGRTTPTATRLEGLLAARSFIPPDDEIDAAIPLGISFLLHAQVGEGEFAGAFPRAIGEINFDISNKDKFNRRATEIRIDYIQHALSAMIQYLDQAKESAF